jgi:hypothetical protein
LVFKIKRLFKNTLKPRDIELSFTSENNDNVKDFIKRITFGYTTTPGILEGHTYQRSKISIYKTD